MGWLSRLNRAGPRCEVWPQMRSTRKSSSKANHGIPLRARWMKGSGRLQPSQICLRTRWASIPWMLLGILTRIDNHAGNGSAMTSNPFCGAMNYDVRAKIDRPDLHTLTSLTISQIDIFTRNPPIPKVLSTISGTPCLCATYEIEYQHTNHRRGVARTLAISRIGLTLNFGFPITSTKTALVFSSIAASKAAGSSDFTNFAPIPYFLR